MNSQKDIIIVTGSSGLIGSALIRPVAKQFQVVGFDLAGDPYPPIEAECVCMDITSEESVQTGLSDPSRGILRLFR
jgi:UDP-glucose 4-epimerase